MIDVIFPNTSTTLSTIGLLLDISGVVLLFKFGLPESLSREGHGFLIVNEDEAEKAKAKQYDQWARLALGLLIFGFAFQIVGNYA